MKILTNHKLLIDVNCPMCVGYSTAFTKLNILPTSGVVDYTSAPEKYTKHIDLNRAKNEIALYDHETKEVKYGIHSMLHILVSLLPFLKKVATNKSVIFFLNKLYKFISYNRKVVIPTKINRVNERACIPDYNVKYRIIFITVLGLLSNVFLYLFLKEIPLYQQAGGTYLEELTLLILQFAWHALVIYGFGHKDKMLDYLGQLAVVLFIGGILLMVIKPLLLFLSVTNSFVWFGGLGITALVMLIMLYKRCKIIGEPNHVILAWFTFRLLVGAWWFYEWGMAEYLTTL